MFNWFFAAGDAGFSFAEQLKSLSWLPIVWHPEYGFGSAALDRLWFDYPYQLFVKILFSVGFSWWLIDKILWMLACGLALYSSYKLASYVLGKSKVSYLASIVYAANTYLLLLFAGGQIGVALAFAFAPFVLLQFIRSVTDTKRKWRQFIANGLWLVLLIAFDLRIAYLIILAAFLYIICSFGSVIKKIPTVILSCIIPLGIAGLIHSFWVLPTIVAGGGTASLGEAFTNQGMLKFLSVADFSHALSFLHPNWPDNLFGKVYFLQPEFLVLPIVAFASLFFIKKDTKERPLIIFFALLSLLGAFFAKGVQPPLGGIFQWMFVHIPGFIMFRDPTKFYLYTAIGYSVLIPYTIFSVLRSIRMNNYQLRITVLSLFLLFWLFTIRGLFAGQVRGNFRPLQLTSDYVHLKDILVSDTRSSRTLWIPSQDKLAYYSDVHPILTADELFNNASMSALLTIIETPSFMNSLSNAGVGYVVVPEDLEQKIFLKDYTFDPGERNAFIEALDKTSLTRDRSFGGLAVYTNSHNNFVIRVPPVIAKQQYFTNIGLIISVVSLFGISVLLVAEKHKK